VGEAVNNLSGLNSSCRVAYNDTPDYNHLEEPIRNSAVQDGIVEDGVVDPERDGCSVHETKKLKLKNCKKPNPTKSSDTPNSLNYKPALIKINSAATEQSMAIKERLPAMLTNLWLRGK